MAADIPILAKLAQGARALTKGLFNKPRLSFPAPDIASEYIIIEQRTVDSREKPFEYGTAHKAYSQAKLIDQNFSEQDNNKSIHTCIYSAHGTLAAQALWNTVSIGYTSDLPADMVVVRRFAIEREQYTPLPLGTADTVFPSCVLVRQEVAPIEGDNFNYSAVRVFEKLPSTPLISEVVTSQGQVATVTRQRVLPNTPVPAPDALTLDASVQNESFGVGVLSVTTVPEVHDSAQRQESYADPIPSEFRAHLKHKSFSLVVPSTQSSPDITPSANHGEFERSYTRDGEFRARISSQQRELPTDAGGMPIHIPNGFNTGYPHLVEYHTDAETGIVIYVVKRLFYGAYPAPAAREPNLDGTIDILEYNQLSTDWGVEIVSSLQGLTLPENEESRRITINRNHSTCARDFRILASPSRR